MGRKSNAKKRTQRKKTQKTKNASCGNKGAEPAASNSCANVEQEIEQMSAEVWKSIRRLDTLSDVMATADTTQLTSGRGHSSTTSDLDTR